MSDSRQAAQLALALVLLVTIVSFSGCGGDSTQSGSVSQTSAISKTHQEGSTDGASAEKPSSNQHRKTRTTDRKDASVKQPHEPIKHSPGNDPNQNRSDSSKNPLKNQASGKASTGGCPKGTSAKDCAAIEKAYEQAAQTGSHASKSNQCPAAMSKGDCAAAGAQVQAGQTEGHVVAPNECPQAMTEAQCIEVGETYAEATR